MTDDKSDLPNPAGIMAVLTANGGRLKRVEHSPQIGEYAIDPQYGGLVTHPDQPAGWFSVRK